MLAATGLAVTGVALLVGYAFGDNFSDHAWVPAVIGLIMVGAGAYLWYGDYVLVPRDGACTNAVGETIPHFLSYIDAEEVDLLQERRKQLRKAAGLSGAPPPVYGPRNLPCYASIGDLRAIHRRGQNFSGRSSSRRPREGRDGRPMFRDGQRVQRGEDQVRDAYFYCPDNTYYGNPGDADPLTAADYEYWNHVHVMDDGENMVYLPKNEGWDDDDGGFDALRRVYRRGRHHLCNSVPKNAVDGEHEWALKHAVAQSCKKPIRGSKVRGPGGWLVPAKSNLFFANQCDDMYQWQHVAQPQRATSSLLQNV